MIAISSTVKLFVTIGSLKFKARWLMHGN